MVDNWFKGNVYSSAAYAVPPESPMLHIRPSRTSEERPYPLTLSVNTSADHLREGESQPFAHAITPTEGGASTADITLNGDDEPSFLDHAEERAIRRLLESWMERLQLISVLVGFSLTSFH